MGLKEKLKATGNVLIFSLLGFIVGANIYNLADFRKCRNYIEENSHLSWLITDGKTYSESYIRKNRKFPNSALTFLSRKDAKNFIEEIERKPSFYNQ